MATHSSILACRIPWTEEPGGFSPWGHEESDTTVVTYTHAHACDLRARIKQHKIKTHRVCIYF